MFRFLTLAALSALLLVTGCSANGNMMKKQSISKESRISNHANTVKTQASSTASSTIKAKDVQNGSDLFNLIQMPTGSTSNQWPPANVRKPAPTSSTGQAPATNNGSSQPANGGSSQFAQQVLNLVNQERSKAGLGSLTMNGSLSNMALAKAQDMYNKNYFDHNSPTYGSPFDMMKQFGITYSYAGENIATGQTTATQVMNDWMNSPGHRANILKSEYTNIGIAFYNNEWVQEFTG